MSFLHRWEYDWKCKFDEDVKIKNYYQHDGEQLAFYIKKHIKTQNKSKDILVDFILQEVQKSNLLDKNCAQGERCRPEVFCKDNIFRDLKKFTEKDLCQSLFFKKVPGLLAQVFSCEFCEIFNSTFFCRTPLVAAYVKRE